jgi:hypothetical protein
MKRMIVLSFLFGLRALAWGAPPPGGNGKEENTAAKAAQKKRAFAQLMKIMKGEPTIKEVQQATLKHYKFEPERIDSMARAARLKGLVPEIDASLDNSVGHNYSNTKDGLYPFLPNPVENPNPGSFKERVSGNNDNLTWHVRAVFNLDRLVFNAEELDVRSLDSLQENLIREVTTLYFGRRRLLANLLLSPPDEDEEVFYEILRLDEMTATIDALTGGMFGEKAWKWDVGQQ